VKREKFCAEYPYLCQKPNNLTNFCGNHPYFCKENVSNLVIPKLEYYASNSEADVRKAISQIYIHNISQDGANLWSWTAPYDHRNKENMTTTTFIFDNDRKVYVTCYSTNLHIYSRVDIISKKTYTILKNDQDLYNFYTRIREEETVYPWTVSGIFLSIHSPFVPVNPFNDGAFLQIGHQYIINIRM
ncbi:hypothetical protein NPIL_433411, partial [Nephila pilipes]